MNDQLNPVRWGERYTEKNTPWDVGGATPALIEWAREQNLRQKRFLIPGCGKGHDAHFLAKAGASVTAVDYAPQAIEEAQAAYPNSKVSWLVDDVTQMSFDQGFHFIWENTCFCALDPSLRDAYFQRVARALAPGGSYFGLVFEKVHEPENGPPFEVSVADFQALLEKHFRVLALEPQTRRSLKDRYPNEIWFQVACL